MHIKFLAHGTGNPARAAAYVIDRKDHQNIERVGVEVLRGDPATFAAIAGSLTSVHRYTSGVIAWSVDDSPSDVEINAVLDDFERVAFAGLEPDEYHYCAVQHTEENGSKHIHILVPRVNLKTGQALNIAPPNWAKSFDPLRDAWNWEKGWSRPDDPARARLVQRGHIEYQDAAAVRAGLQVEPDPKQLLSDYIVQRVKAGVITSRADVVDALAELGKVTRQGSDYVSVKPEGFDKAIRLRGGLFDERFDPKTWIDAAREDQRGQATYRAGREAVTQEHRRCAEAARERLAQAIERRERYNRERYKRNDETLNGLAIENGGSHQQHLEISNSFVQSSDRGGHKTTDLDDSATVLALVNRFVSRNAGTVDCDANRTLERNDNDRKNGGQQSIHSHNVTELEDLHNQQQIVSLQNERISNDKFRENAIRAVEGIKRAIQFAGEQIESTIQFVNNAIKGNESAIREHDRELSSFTTSASVVVANRGAIAEGVKILRQNNEEEIRRFKSDINLAEFLQNRGYEYDKKESSKNSAVMRRGSDKLIVATDQDGHGIYFSVRDEKDNGTIIDFIQQREGLNLGQVRKMLRPWIGESSTPIPSPISPIPKPEKAAPSLVMAQARYLEMQEYTGNYLQSRGLSKATIDEFSPRIRQDSKGNVCFRHWHPEGISGYEIKNAGFTGFASGGEKSLFTIVTGDKISRIVITESAIDCMSYHQLKGQKDTLYLSIAGQMNENQRDSIRNILTDQEQAAVISAFDNDEQGNKFAAFISEIRPDAKRECPEIGKDWNDQLKSTVQMQRSRFDYPKPF